MVEDDYPLYSARFFHSLSGEGETGRFEGASAVDTEFEIDAEPVCYTECPYVPSTAVISQRVTNALKQLLSRFSDLEFLIYVYGEVKDGRIYVNDFYVPKQTVTGASVEVDEVPPGEKNGWKLLGSIHSHNNMSAFHSHTDDEHHNYPLMIVVNNNLEYSAKYKAKVPCGSMLIKSISVIFREYDDVVSENDIAKIEEKTYAYYRRYSTFDPYLRSYTSDYTYTYEDYAEKTKKSKKKKKKKKR